MAWNCNKNLGLTLIFKYSWTNSILFAKIKTESKPKMLKKDRETLKQQRKQEKEDLKSQSELIHASDGL